ncbi:MAG: response regulator, partial [Brevundimonas sp.]
YITAVTVAVGVFIGFCLQTWKRMNDASLAEAGARLDADRKRLDAERAMASRSAFLAAVGHDLRTPISAILTGASEMERLGDPSSRANAQLITDAGMMMKAMLDDLLDHSKLDAGRMTVDSVDFDLRQMFAQTVKLWQAPARAKGLTLRFEGAAQTPDCVCGDPMRLRQVLNNLISNAMKFTSEGSITLRVRAWTDPLNDYSLVVDVIDTGPGMTLDQIGRLFTPFDQTAEGVSARHGGTGLGLAISRDLAQLMGGRLTARSAPGQGACFTLSLNLGRAETSIATLTSDLDQGRAAVARALSLSPVRDPMAATATPAPVATPIESAPVAETADAVEDDDEGRALRVLVVDDHEINRRAIQLILAPMGCDIATAADGLQALDVAAASPFDVIFMDVRMPELDGRETTRRLRAGDGVNASTPVIAVTADTAPEDIAACSAAGMNFFVSKPLTPAALLGALSQVLAGIDEDVAAETVAA